MFRYRKQLDGLLGPYNKIKPVLLRSHGSLDNKRTVARNTWCRWWRGAVGIVLKIGQTANEPIQINQQANPVVSDRRQLVVPQSWGARLVKYFRRKITSES